jgi:putative IMPACT (imprinted ancient) family translation regulator
VTLRYHYLSWRIGMLQFCNKTVTNRHIGVRTKLFGVILSGCGGIAFHYGDSLCHSTKNAGAASSMQQKKRRATTRSRVVQETGKVVRIFNLT